MTTSISSEAVWNHKENIWKIESFKKRGKMGLKKSWKANGQTYKASNRADVCSL